jgi:hypothetical protein
MNRKFIVAILLVAALPAYVQAQNPRVSKGDAQKVATIISSDKIKTQAYCDIQKLAEQVAEANEKKDVGRVNELFEKIETLGKNYRSRICRIDRWGSGHREKWAAPCGVFVGIWSTRQAVYQVSLENPNAPAATSRY